MNRRPRPHTRRHVSPRQHAKLSLILPLAAVACLLPAGCDDATTGDAVDQTTEETAAAPAHSNGDTDAPDTGSNSHANDDAPEIPKPWTPSPNPRLASFLGLEAPKPVTWIEHPPSRLHCIATYILPGRDGSPQAHINVFYLGEDSGGDVNTNLIMWAQQFRTTEGDEVHPKVYEIEADGMKVTIAQYIGEHMPKASSYFKPDHEKIVAIVESPHGKVFIDLLGVTETVDIHRDAYLKMIQGLRRADKPDTDAG